MYVSHPLALLLPLETMTRPGLANAAGYLLFFGGLALTVAWAAYLMR